MKHDPALIGAPVHVYNQSWVDPTMPRAGFIDGFSEDAGMFSVTVDTSNADHRRGTALRVYLRRCLVVQSLADRPVGVDVVAVLRPGVVVNTAEPVRPTESLAVVAGGKAPSERTPGTTAPVLPEYTEDPDEDQEDAGPDPEPPPPARQHAAKAPAKPAKKAAGKKVSKKAPAKPTKTPAPRARVIEPLPPGVSPGDQGPEAPGFPGSGVAGIVPEKPGIGADGDPIAMRPPTQETRPPIDQLMASPSWKIVEELTQSHRVAATRTGQKELSVFLPEEDRPVAKVLWISAKPNPQGGPPVGGGFCIKIRDRGGRCSITLAEGMRDPAHVQRELSRMARAVRAAGRADPGDWGSSHANMQSELAAE